jgi:hypothetical protein
MVSAIVLALLAGAGGEVLPTDVELRAAYCIGRIGNKDIDTSTLPPEAKPGVERLNERMRIAREKYLAYMAPRLGIISSEATLAAVQQGQRASGRVISDCEDPTSEACRRAGEDGKNCLDASFLPF